MIQKIMDFGVCNFTTEELQNIKNDLLQHLAQGKELEPMTAEVLDLVDAELNKRGMQN